MDNTDRYLERLQEQSPLSRRELGRLLGGTALAGAVGSMSDYAWATETKSTFRALELNHIALRVSDPGRSAEFYRRHLGMEVVLDRPFAKFLGCGPHFVALFRGDQPGLDHFCVTIPDYDQSEAAESLRRAGLEPHLEENRTYFHDPDGLKLQLESALSWPGEGPRPDQPSKRR